MRIPLLRAFSSTTSIGPAPPENLTILQAFEWHVPADQSHWRRLHTALSSLKSIGIDAFWIPPGCKAGGRFSNGYDPYDLYDLGEFHQKGERSTKWGSREELVDMAKEAEKLGVGIYWDAVLNHRAHADRIETCWAVKVDPRDRRKEIGESHEIESWTGFDFPGRGTWHSHVKYHWHHFSGIDYDCRSQTNAIYKFIGDGKPGFAQDVSKELGNYDYLMLADVDYSSPEVRSDVLYWGEWLGHQLPISGIRLDAVKHYSADFQKAFIDNLQRTVGKNWFFVGEYWSPDVEILSRHLQKFDGKMSLFDVQLCYNLSHASKVRKPDLRRLFEGTLCQRHPDNTVTFVTNHDTQEGQSLASPIQAWFTVHSHALILLHALSTRPCVFYGDLYGTLGPSPRPPPSFSRLPRLILTRKLYAYGLQNSYLDDSSCIGWTRSGHPSRSAGAGLAVIMSAGWKPTRKKMYVGSHHAGERWTDILAWNWGEVVIDRRGWGLFRVEGRAVAVWVHADAAGRDKVDNLKFDDKIYDTAKNTLNGHL